MTLVFNASPLIVLAKAGYLDAVSPLAKTILIPKPVAEEIARVDDPTDAARFWIEQPAHESFVREAPSESQFARAWSLGVGETSVLTLALDLAEPIVVLDDLAARRRADVLGLKKIGTLGLLLMAKREGKIASLEHALKAVIGAGLFVAPRHVEDALKRAGEWSARGAP